MDVANAFLPSFTDRYKAKFAKAPRRVDNLYRSMNTEPDRLRDVFCFRDERSAGPQLAFSYGKPPIFNGVHS